MKKYFLFLISLIFVLSILSFLFLNINIFISKKNDIEVLERLNLKEVVITDSNLLLPSLEIDNQDYVGSIKVLENNIPIRSNCNKYFNYQSSCLYSRDSFIVLGSNLSNSFSLYSFYDVGDKVSFINTLGNLYEFKIEKIDRVDNLNNLDKYNSDLLIIVKNYYGGEIVVIVGKNY